MFLSGVAKHSEPGFSLGNPVLRLAVLLFLNGLLCLHFSAGEGVSLSPEARYHGAQGVRLFAPSNGPRLLEDDTPNDASRYRARFYLNLTHLQVASNGRFELFQGLDAAGETQFRVRVLQKNQALHLDLGIRLDSGLVLGLSPASTVTFPVGYRSVELDFLAGEGNGHLRMWVDGVLAAEILGVDNDTARVDRTQMGIAGTPSGSISGFIDFDEFQARHTGYIGPLTCIATYQLLQAVGAWLPSNQVIELVNLVNDACPQP